MVALVDDEDFDDLSHHVWHYRNGYAYAVISMHRSVVSEESKFTDHINGNRLDNRRSNLRACTQTENNRNKGKSSKARQSKYKGVSLVRGRWVARIGNTAKVNSYIGCFDTEVGAAVAYDTAAVKYFGEFARLNFPKKST